MKNLRLIDNQDVVNFGQNDIFINLDGEFEYGSDFDFIALEMVKTLKLKVAGRKAQKGQQEIVTSEEDWTVGSMLSFLEKYSLISFDLSIQADSTQTDPEAEAKAIINRLSLFNEENVSAFTTSEKIDEFHESVEMIAENQAKRVWGKFSQLGKDFDPENSSGENPVELAILLLGFSLYFHKENAEKIYWILDRFEKAYYEIYSSSRKDVSDVSSYLFLLLGDVKYYLFKFI
ncbi:MAG: hypothetical protein WC848_02110 [Parcubacteria group bacterium]